MNSKELDQIVVEFNSTVIKTLKICQKFEPNNIDLIWLRKQVSIARDNAPFYIIDKCSDKMWAYKEHIINEDAVFFLNNKFDGLIKEDGNKSFLVSFTNLLKSRYSTMSKPEQKILWTLVKSMLASIAKYKKATGNFV